MWRGRPHFSFLMGMRVSGTGALTENVERGPHFSFFLRSEPGTGASLQKMWRGDRTFFPFFFGLNLEQVLAYRKCGEGIFLFLFAV